MALIHKYNKHNSVVPANVIGSLSIEDDLFAQRSEAHSILQDSFAIYNDYSRDGAHPLVNAATSRFALARNDHTTLRPNASEDKAYMRRMLERSLFPIPCRALCSREEQMVMALDIIRETPKLMDVIKSNPDFRLAFVSGHTNAPAFPHFYVEEGDIRADLERKAIIKDKAAQSGINVSWDYDSVIPYWHWMQGDHDTVRRLLEVESAETKAHGFTWKSIQKLSAQAHDTHNKAYGADYFKSAYESSMVALEAGADCVKTSSGLAALPPLHDFASKDDGAYAAKCLPMLYAIRDFNANNGQSRWPKFSGGNISEVDAAVVLHMAKKICGEDISAKTVIGAGTTFRDNNIRFIYKEEGAKSGIRPEDFGPYGYDVSTLSPHRLGWAGANALNASEATLPPELIRAKQKPVTPTLPAPDHN